MIETREKIIDGATYTVTQLPARRAIRLKAKLIKTFGSFLLGSDGKNLQAICESLDENQFEALCMEMLQGVRKNGVELTPAKFDLEFAGDIAGVYKLLLFVVEVNYANFFSMFGIGLPSFSEEQVPTNVTKKTFTGK
jgi:hypothetical protein